MDLVGRHDAIGAVRAALVAGHGTVVLAGPVGSGVTAVLDAVAEQAADDFGRVVVRAAGRPAERHVALALLRELAARDRTGALAEGMDADEPAEVLWSFAVGHDDGLTIVVDDLHLADTPSHDAITHLARRSDLAGTVVVIGTHGESLDGVTVVELAPLTDEELIAVLAERGDVTDESVRRRIASLADGSPLVAIEVAKALDDAQRRGGEPLPSFAVTATPIRHAFQHVFEGMKEEARRALCLAAAEPTGEVRTVAAALEALSGSIDDLAEAEECGVIEIGDGRIRFDHPIRRSVAYHLLAPRSRRAAHRALANVLDRPQDAERRAAHLAVGVVEPDERIASDLEAVAEAAERRRDRLEARRWWRAAAALSPAADDADRRTRRADGVDEVSDPLEALTKAERRVAAVVGGGASNKAAAETLYVSVKTIDAHLQSIYRKLGIGARAELAVLVTQADLAGAAAAG